MVMRVGVRVVMRVRVGVKMVMRIMDGDEGNGGW